MPSMSYGVLKGTNKPVGRTQSVLLWLEMSLYVHVLVLVCMEILIGWQVYHMKSAVNISLCVFFYDCMNLNLV